MKSSGIQALNRQKALDNYVQEESVALKNQIATLQAQLLEKDKIITSQGNTINQTNNQLSSMQNTLSAKNSEITSLQKELSTYKNSMTNLEKSLKQKNNIIEMVSKNVEELRLEKQKLREDKNALKNLLSSNEEKLKEKEFQQKEFQLSLIQKPINEFDESNIDIDKIFELVKENQTIKSEYINQEESHLVGENSSFVVIKNE
jgi:chromosome segregation ATPase